MTVSDGLPTGDRLYRIHWLPGTDTLRGTCHCGAERTADDPVELWQWLLDHPRDHLVDQPRDHLTPGAMPAARRTPAGAARRTSVPA